MTDRGVPALHSQPRSTGWIEVICGSMFSGKTQELIRRLRLATIAKQKVQVFNSSLDQRYAKDHIVSHDRHQIPSIAVRSARQILKRVDPQTRVVAVDEVQFFDPDIVRVCERLAGSGRRVIVAGLDQDYRGRPFEITARLLALGEFVSKQLAICVQCGDPANKSQRLSRSKKRIQVGASTHYEARCRKCFKP